MKSSSYDDEARRIRRQLPSGPRVAVIGSQSFWGDDSEKICTAFGAGLGRVADVVLLTGGVGGVGEAVGRAFFQAREYLSLAPNTFHVLPMDDEAWDYGVTVFTGCTMDDRREVLARLASVYVCIEGGPGTAHEAKVVRQMGKLMVPIGRTGGVAKQLHASIPRPERVAARDWASLGDDDCPAEEVAGAVLTTVDILLQRSD